MTEYNVKKILSLVLVIGTFGFFVSRLANKPVHDFANSYFPAVFFKQGNLDISIFDPGEFNKQIAATGQQGVLANFNPNPPSVAVFFMPFSFFEIQSAKILFVGLSFLFFLVSVYRLSNFYSVPWENCFLLVPVFFFTSFKTNILFGQSYFLVTALLIEGFLAYKTEKIFTSSFLWSIAAFIKIFPLIISLFLILKKKTRQTIVFACVLAGMGVIFVAMLGIPLWKYYLLEILPRSFSGDLHSAYTATTQSAFMLFKYLFIYDNVLNDSPWIASPLFFFAMVSLFSSVIIAVLCRFVTKEEESKSFWVLIFGSLLLSPQGSTYSTILLLPLLIAVYSEKKKNGWIILVLVIIICNIPIGFFKTLPLMFQFSRLWIMLLLMVVILIQANVYPSVRLILILFPILLTPKLIHYFQQRGESITFVDYELKPLITDYKIIDGQIYVVWRNESGEHTEGTGKKATLSSTQNIYIVKNQIVFNGKQVTQTFDTKKKPMVVNGNEILYMSDKGKGIGFFAIRKLKAL